jgi:hypothetical protein
MDRVMTQLLVLYQPSILPNGADLNLYCWRCRAAHSFTVADIERLVYALATDAADRSERADRVPIEDYQPSCYHEVLRWAGDSEMYAEWVEQGVECRSAVDDPPPAVGPLDD